MEKLKTKRTYIKKQKSTISEKSNEIVIVTAPKVVDEGWGKGVRETNLR